jgi:hypothetical protein
MQDKIFYFFTLVPTFEEDHLSKNTYGNPLSFGLYNHSQRDEMVKFVNGKGEIIQFSNLSRYSRTLSRRPVTTFMLALPGVPGSSTRSNSCHALMEVTG